MATPEKSNIMVAMSVIAQALDLAKASGEPACSRLLKRLEGAFRNPDDMRAMRMELHTATHLHRLGSRVEWSDECSGRETFDLLIVSASGQEIEVECKTWSEDKGSAITVEQASGLLQHLDKTKLIETVSAGEILAAIFSVSAGLPRGEPEQRQLAHHLVEAIVKSEPTVTDVGKINLKRLSAPQIEKFRDDACDNYCVQLVNAAVGQAYGYRLVFRDHHRAVIVELRSERESKKFSRMLKDAKHAIRKQMTGSRPGCLVVRLEGVREAELRGWVAEEGSVPAVFAYALFQDEKHEHLDSIVWLSDPALQELAPDVSSNQSASCVMSRIQGRYSHLDIGKMFNFPSDHRPNF